MWGSLARGFRGALDLEFGMIVVGWIRRVGLEVLGFRVGVASLRGLRFGLSRLRVKDVD